MLPLILGPSNGYKPAEKRPWNSNAQNDYQPPNQVVSYVQMYTPVYDDQRCCNEPFEAIE